MLGWLQRRLHGEEGMAMLIAIVLSSVIMTLSVMMLSVGSHSDKSTARGRHWVQALHVAESGVEDAIDRLEDNGGAFTGTFSGATEEGAYSVTVTQLARGRFQVDATGTVRGGRQLEAARTLRVTLAPPRTFSAALFSFTTVETKNNDVIEGDIWANENLILADGTEVTGSGTAATGYVVLGNNAIVNGDAVSGGFNPDTNYAIHLKPNSRIGGNATASVTAPPDPISCGGASNANYKLRNQSGSVIAGNARTWGQLEGSGQVLGTISNNSCTAAPPARAMPGFTYSPANYDATTLHEFGTPGAPSATAVDQFQAYVAGQSNAISGTFYINQATPVGQNERVDLTGVTFTGDATIITNTPIFTNGASDSGTNNIVTLISTYRPPTGSVCDVNQDNSECSAHIKNNFQVAPDDSCPTAVLVYTPYGPTAVKNNAIQCGAVYAENIQIKNNQTLTYDERVDRVVGFGPVTYEIIQWLELNA